MSVRSVNVRYSANVAGLVSSLTAAAAANDRLEGSTKRAGAGLTAQEKIAGGLILAVGGAVAKFAEFDSVMSQVAAATGATGDELDSLRNAAIDAGRSTQFSASEAAQGITELAKAGVSAKDIIGGGLTGALDLAAAGQIGVGEAAETAATAMTQFKLSGGQVSHIADLLAAGANKAQGGVHDLGMALRQSGLVASQVGLSIEETTAGLTAFAAAGLIGSDAGTSFKTMLQRLTPQSDTAKAKMDELGISAYDSQGQFIGLAKFAGNLRQALKDLTPEQRNSAMATIFGTDAVRAANVLYENGAEGIRKWTKEVDAQGYAAKQAATLTDNLRGDLKRLGSMVESVLINDGSAANDTLRSLVQTATGLVDAIGAIPGPVLLGAAALGVMAGMGPRIERAAGKITGPLLGGVRQFRDEMTLHRALATQVQGGYRRLGDEAITAGSKVTRSSVAMSAARTTIGGLKGAAGGLLSALGGPWTIALTGAAVVVGKWAQANAEAKQQQRELTEAIRADSGAIGDNTRAKVANQLESEGILQTARELGVNLADVTEAALGNAAAQERVNEQIAVSKGLLADQVAGTINAADSIVEWQGKADSLTGALSGQNAELQNSIDAYKRTEEAQGGTKASTDGLTGAIDSQAAAADAATGPSSGLTFMLDQLGQASSDAKTEIDGLKNAVDLLSGGELALRASQRELEQAIEDAGKAAKEKASKTKSAAEVERDYQAAVDRVATATDGVIKRLIENGASQDQLKAAYDRGRGAIEEQLRLRGLHGKKLQEETDKIIGTRSNFALLLGQYAKTPDEVSTTVKANTNPAHNAARNIQREIDDLHGKTVVVNVATFGLAAAAQARRVIADIRDIRSAAGNIVYAYAGGGIGGAGDVANAHMPQIAPAGSWRVFGEPETQGETYIPWANDWRRPRAKRLLEVTASQFGGTVQWNAVGGINAPAIDYGRMAAAVSGGRTLTEADVAAVAAAVRQGAFDGVAAGGAQAGMVARRRDRQAGGVTA